MPAAEPLTPLATRLLEGRNLGHLATVNPNGSVQVTPVWVHVEDGLPVFNTAEGRRKWHNMRRDPRVTIEITDADDTYTYVEIRGTAEFVLDGAFEHIEELSEKYTGEPFQGHQQDVRRVKVIVSPTRVLDH